MAEHVKGVTPSEVSYDGSGLRVAIVHARWNKVIIDALVKGAMDKLLERGVQRSNIVVQAVPGSFELPLACSKVLAAGHVQAGATATDLLGGLNFGGSTPSLTSPTMGSTARSTAPPQSSGSMAPNRPFDAIIAIGVLIKGSTMHFEYICDSVSHALMRLQMDSGVPVIFGVLTCLSDGQALERAGIGKGLNKGHNHGEDWGLAAVEMACQCKRWGEGLF